MGTYLVLGGPHALGLLHLHWEAALVLFLYLILGNLCNNSFMLGRYFRSYIAHPLYTVLLLLLLYTFLLLTCSFFCLSLSLYLRSIV